VEVLSLYALAFIWFKYLIIWRVARATAMFDGVEVYENMNRCIFNNYSVEGFWRAWHRGFNQWIIRYLFVPLGGSKRKTISVWPIFAFVALWHDANPRLVIWAWLCCLTMLPEILIRHYSKKLACYQARWFNYLSALGNALVIKLLVLLNCIGFGLGDSGLAGLQTTASHWSLAEWSFSLVVVSLAVHLMYHVRDL
jgi:protein-cysteine N-palmitoyltransferase HHAT